MVEKTIAKLVKKPVWIYKTIDAYRKIETPEYVEKVINYTQTIERPVVFEEFSGFNVAVDTENHSENRETVTITHDVLRPIVKEIPMTTIKHVFRPVTSTVEVENVIIEKLNTVKNATKVVETAKYID